MFVINLFNTISKTTMKTGWFILTVVLLLTTLSGTYMYAQQNCLNGNFYMIGNASGGGRAIYPVYMNGSSLTVSVSQPVPGGNNSSLAIADPDGAGNTFWSSTYNPIAITKYSGGAWQTVWTDTSGSTIPLANAAGNGPYLYYHSGKGFSWPNRIVRFDGTQAITIWQDTTLYSNVADIAVDDSGNVYFFTGTTPYDVTDLKIMSPSGNILATLPLSFSFDAVWTYGAFFDNNILWLPFGSSNLNFPSQVVPITITPTLASIGTPVNIPAYTIGSGPNGPLYLTFVDAASCGHAAFPFLSTGLAGTDFSHPAIGPNPAAEQISISWKEVQHRKMTLTDMTGHVLFAGESEADRYVINTEMLPPGIYLLGVQEGHLVSYTKVCKQ